MTRESTTTTAPRVLDRLHHRLEQLLAVGPHPDDRDQGYRYGITSAKIFVLDERAQQSGTLISARRTK